MFTRNRDNADRRQRAGLTSYCLLARGDAETDELAVTCVDVEPGGRQVPHSHPETQVYVILAGRGRMTVGKSSRNVCAGELVHVPSNAVHGIENTASILLSYVSAATPAFDYTEAYDRGQLQPDAFGRK